MLPIAAEIAVRMTREQAQSALPNAPVVPDGHDEGPRAPSRSKRMTAGLLRRVAATSVGLADRIERPAGAS